MALPLPGEPAFLEWLAHNPTGIRRSAALGRAVVGTGLAGLLSAAALRRTCPSAPAARIGELVGAVVVGGVAAPLVVTAATYYLDRSLLRQEELLGYSGVMRELLHAGELSFLGALGAGLAQSVEGGGRGTAVSTLGTGVTGALLYAVRGFGPGLGAGAGLLSGLVGGLLSLAVGPRRQRRSA
jgi:hypothetical protein